MPRNYAALPHEYLEEMEALSDAEFGRLCRALLKYSMTGEEEQLQGAERLLLKRVFLQERRYQDSYNQLIDKKRSSGKKGASKRWGKMAKHSTAMAHDGTGMAHDGKNGYTETETKTETKTETNTPPPNGGRSEVECAKKRIQQPPAAPDGPKNKKFIPPTVEEVAAYVQERGSKVNPQQFVDFYAAKGWMVGKTPMKDWKAACRNAEKWERWQKPAQPGGYNKPVDRPTPSGNNFLQHGARRPLRITRDEEEKVAEISENPDAEPDE